ncbi:hypothetical protein QE152_g39123 [Popillia japonica]|uniref:TIL domain-containing protein n=1 Tax=Popillia japonica TaxID=7064 RepID=A0AAW1HUR2_POPJA
MLKVSYLLLVLFAVISLAVCHVGPIVCDRANEHYACGSGCQRECRTLEGYARDAEGTCIPISECPPKISNF